jgi:hypothetical protein
MASTTPGSSPPIFGGPSTPIKVLTSLAWSGKIEKVGRAGFESNRTDANMKHVIRNNEPARERGISPGDVGKFASSLSFSEGCESVL